MSKELWKCRIIETEALGEFQLGGVNKVMIPQTRVYEPLILSVGRVTHNAKVQLQREEEEKNMFTFAWIGTDLNTFIWIKFLSH